MKIKYETSKITSPAAAKMKNECVTLRLLISSASAVSARYTCHLNQSTLQGMV